MEILYEDNHLLVVVKPAGLPTMGTPGGRPTLLTEAKEYVKRRYHKPGNVYLGVVSRLDAPVTGVVLLARTSKVAARLTEQFRTRQVEKTYWAVVEGVVEPAEGRLVDWLGQDERHRRMHIVGPTMPGAQEARLTYRRLGVLGGKGDSPIFAGTKIGTVPSAKIGTVSCSWLEVELETGRKHQIRLQLAHHGHPVVGDRKYGSTTPFSPGIALHARRLVVSHPTTGERLTFEAPLPAVWRGLGISPA
jgi:23S rRNA pseudouridine1911/1915/1917 synthase